MPIYSKTYLNLINKLRYIGKQHKFIHTTTVGDIFDIDLSKETIFPLMHINPVNVTTGYSQLSYNFQIFVCDLVSEKKEWNRIEKIIKKISKTITLSLDTRKSEIMNKGIKIGIKLINDVSGLSYDPKTIDVLKKSKIPFVIQHSQGTPENMQNNPSYKNELLDIYDFFEERVKFLRSKGIKHNNIIVDPGIGFGKNLKHNMNLIRSVSIFHTLGFPILLGLSRKKFIKDLSGKNDTKERMGGTVASSLYSMMQGVQILRIHDVNELIQSIKVFKRLIKN